MTTNNSTETPEVTKQPSTSGWYVLCLAWLVFGSAFLIFSRTFVKPAADITNSQMVLLGTQYGAYVGFGLGLVTFLITGLVYLILRLFIRKARLSTACIITALGYGAWLAFGYDLVYLEPRYAEIARAIITYLGKPMLYSAGVTVGLAALGIVASIFILASRRSK